MHMVKIFEIHSTCFQTNGLQDLCLHVSKNVFFQNFGACIRNGNLGAFLVKNVVKEL